MEELVFEWLTQSPPLDRANAHAEGLHCKICGGDAAFFTWSTTISAARWSSIPTDRRASRRRPSLQRMWVHFHGVFRYVDAG